jgi:hypothetical protein
MIKIAVRAWVVSALALAAAGAGLAALAAGSPVTSLGRMAVAAGVLAAYTATVGIVVTNRAARSRRRCLLWGAAVPTAVGMVNAIWVTMAAGISQGLLSSLPWLGGALLVSMFGPLLPELLSQHNPLRASRIARR